MLLIINYNIFVHATIQQVPFTYIQQFNNIVNNPTIKNEYIHLLYQFYIKNNSLANFLWGRNYDAKITCPEIKKDLAKFFSTTPDDNIINLYRIIVGHCIQLNDRDKLNMTTYDITYKDAIVEILSDKTSTGIQDVKLNRLYGISMMCPKNLNHSVHSLYRVDSGTSRTQDQFYLNKQQINAIKDNYNEDYFLKSRVPQVLEIIGNNFSIIRSTIKNTRIHQSRPTYEAHAKLIPDLNLNSVNYQKKYLKYKSKYLQLKLNSNDI